MLARFSGLKNVRSITLDSSRWIDTNQLGRRNLSPDVASLLRGRIYNRVKKHRGGDRKSTHQIDGLIPAAEKLATQYGVGKATIERDGQFARAVDVVKEADAGFHPS